MTELLESPSTVDGWTRALRGMPTVSLARANEVAALQTRRDRKYLVPPELLHAVVAGLPDVGALEINGRLVHRYRSLYFDTEQLDLYRLAATGRRRRYKVRRREYVDDQLCMLEVKTKDSRGRTVKARTELIGGDECRPLGTRARVRGRRVARSGHRARARVAAAAVGRDRLPAHHAASPRENSGERRSTSISWVHPPVARRFRWVAAW